MPVARESRRADAGAGRRAPEQADAPSVLEEGAQGRASGAARTLGAHGRCSATASCRARSTAARARCYNPLTFAVVGVDRQQGGAGARLTLPWRRRRHESRERRRRRAVAQRRAKELGELQRRRDARPRRVRRSPSRRASSRSTSASSCRASVRTCATSWRSAASARPPACAPIRCASSCRITISPTAATTPAIARCTR